MLPRVELFDGTDIYKLGYIDKLPKIAESKTLGRDKLVQNEAVFNVNNFDNFFSVDNPKSNFSNTRWRYKSIKWFDEDGTLRWDGIIRDIISLHAKNKKTGKLVSNNVLSKFLNHNIEYESATWESPAQVFLKICDAIGFKAINLRSIEASDALYQNNNCFIKAFFGREDDITFQQAVDKIAMLGAADIYGHNNNLYFDLFREFTGGVVYTINDTDMISLPVVKSLESELINNYSINYVDSNETPATDLNSNNLGRISRKEENNGIHDMAEIDGDEGNDIEIKDKVSAVYLGEQNVKRTHKNLDNSRAGSLREILFEMSEKFKNLIDITTFFRMNLSDEGWNNKIFETYGAEIDSDRNILKLIAIEREKKNA